MPFENSEFLGVGMGWGFRAEGDETCGPAVACDAGPTLGACPLRVLQGAKRKNTDLARPEPGVSVGLDWIRATGPGACEADLVDWVERNFGVMTFESKGFHFYTTARRYGTGAVVLTEHKSADSCCVELSGSVLASFDGARRVEFLRDLAEMGMKPTRIDVALDVVAEGVHLVQSVRAACNAGALCGAKSHDESVAHGQHGELTKNMHSIGARGKDGSGRYVRAYDKGLEQGERANQWHRWETEFSDSCAQQVAQVLIFAANAVASMQAMALGAVDFRDGDKSQRVETRVRQAWWAELLAGIETLCVRAVRVLSTAYGQLQHLRRSVAPVLAALAEESGGRVLDVWRCVCASVKPEAVERHRARGRLGELLELAGMMPGVGLQRSFSYAGEIR